MQSTIIIPTHNRHDMLMDLLRSLSTPLADHSGCDIVVVDDGSTDGTAEDVAAHFPEVRLLRNTVSRGPSRARNLGAEQSEGKLLLFLDADGVVDDTWLSAMLATDTGDTLLLGNVVDYYGGRTQSVPRRATFLGKSLPRQPERANTGPSSNLGIPRTCFEALGGFDEELPYYFEDSDLCIRAARAGFKFTFVPGAIFRHRGSERKTGDAIRMQEHNSTYAMLKFYEDDIPRSLAFSLLNGTWMLTRLIGWGIRGRFSDMTLLLRGWASAYTRYLRARL